MAALASISVASIIIGFISFAFTLGTFFRVFWQEFQGFWSAPKQAHLVLSNIRQTLYEEKQQLRREKRHHRSDSRSMSRKRAEEDDGRLKLLRVTMRNVVREFKRLEKPFLADPDQDTGIELDYSSGDFSPRYCTVDVRHRLTWLRTKGNILSLSETLQRLQTRRIARDVNEAVL